MSVVLHEDLTVVSLHAMGNKRVMYKADHQLAGLGVVSVGGSRGTSPSLASASNTAPAGLCVRAWEGSQSQSIFIYLFNSVTATCYYHMEFNTSAVCHFTNAAIICKQTKLTSLTELISRRRTSLFGHIARLDAAVPAHQALWLQTNISTGRNPGTSWKRLPGRARKTWTSQIPDDTGMSSRA